MADGADSASFGILSGDSIPDHETLQRELLRAAAAGDADYVERLLQFDFDLNAVPGNGDSPLMLAVEAQSGESVLALLKRGADPNLANAKGYVPLHTAVKNEDIIAVRELAQHKANLDIEVPFVGTPALLAAKANSLDILAYLLNAKANPDISTLGDTVLSVAAESNNLEMLEYVMGSAPDLEAIDTNGHTSLMIASQKGFTEVVRVLLSAKANPTHISRAGSTPIYLADFMGHADVVSLLEQFGATIDNAELLKLHTLVCNGDLRSAHLVVRGGVDINASRRPDGFNALMLASQHGYADIVEYLLDQPTIDVTVRNKQEQSALHTACMAKDDAAKVRSGEVVRQLAEKFRQVREQAAAEAAAMEEKQDAKAASNPSSKNHGPSSGKNRGIYGTMSGGPVAAGPEIGHIDEWDSNGRTALHHAV
eukprot:INCI3629.2.p1 GENE.INCI3629.2~~INCI3629.2.p1  ORF type:complete len:449 (-),score=106.17 INCI3629.2:1500-2771(-)